MKILDIFKFALNNIVHSKSRTIITSIIVFIIGTLIMSILVITTNFSINLNTLQSRIMENVDSKVQITKYSYNEFDEKNNEYLIKEDIDKIIAATNKYSNVVNSLEIESVNATLFYHPDVKKLEQNEFGSYSQFFTSNNEFRAKFMSFDFPCQYSIIDGRYWSSKDSNTNGIWVTKNFILKQMDNGNRIKVGDTIYLNKSLVVYDDLDPYISIGHYYSDAYVVRGIIEEVTLGTYMYDFVIDLEYGASKYHSVLLNSYVVTSLYRSPKGDYNFNNIYTNTEKLSKLIKVELSAENKTIEVKSTLINDMKFMRLIGISVVGLGVLIGFIIILLSVGSIGNTIIISTDKNKKFFGLLKAIGLKKKDMLGIVQVESGITIGVGIGLSTILILYIKDYFISILNMVFDAFSYEVSLTQFELSFSLPIYLPLGVIAAYMGLGFFFSKTSVLEIANMDAISIISEVS